MGILRGVDKTTIIPLIETVISAGLKTLEITMNTHEAEQIIQTAVKTAAGRLTIGAGTVVSMENLHKALDAKATFIVSPTLIPDIVNYCVKNNIPVFPGALTPQEIYNAWQKGATMIKVFPAKFFGSDYFKEIKGPFEKIKLLACGGITAESLPSFHKCKADAFAFGASIFKKTWLDEKNFTAIREAIKTLITVYTKL